MEKRTKITIGFNIVKRRAQVKKKPIPFFLGLVLFFASLVVAQTNHDLSMISSLILGMLGMAGMPINEKLHLTEIYTR